MAPPLVKVQIDFEVRVALVIIKRSSGRRGEGALGKVKLSPGSYGRYASQWPTASKLPALAVMPEMALLWLLWSWKKISDRQGTSGLFQAVGGHSQPGPRGPGGRAQERESPGRGINSSPCGGGCRQRPGPVLSAQTPAE